MSKYYRENKKFYEPDFQDPELNPVKAVQADRDDADINKIIAKFQKGQNMVRINSKEPFYGDVTGFDGLADAYMKIQEAEDLFMDYDASIREKFDNDPVKFVEFLEDDKNYEEALKLGVVQKRPDNTTPPAETPPAK
ncbi:MAG: internal scaffolding protein [Microviridae sp.]|nr:MAG: internal scaffolding protein [Microviridae sp.]